MPIQYTYHRDSKSQWFENLFSFFYLLFIRDVGWACSNVGVLSAPPRPPRLPTESRDREKWSAKIWGGRVPPSGIKAIFWPFRISNDGLLTSAYRFFNCYEHTVTYNIKDRYSAVSTEQDCCTDFDNHLYCWKDVQHLVGNCSIDFCD